MKSYDFSLFTVVLTFFCTSLFCLQKTMKATASTKNGHTKLVILKCTQPGRVTHLSSLLLANYSSGVHACGPRQASQPTPWVTYR